MRLGPALVLAVSVAPGDWLLVQTGLAVAKITEAEARGQIDFQTRGASHEAT